jgi:hypothetical protein
LIGLIVSKTARENACPAYSGYDILAKALNK